MQCGALSGEKRIMVRKTILILLKATARKQNEGQQWTWISYAPEFRLIFGIIVGPRTSGIALSLIALTASIVMGVPCYFSDGFSCYYNALLEQYYRLKGFPRTGKPGHPKLPVKEPHPGFVYARVVKDKKRADYFQYLRQIKKRFEFG